MGAVKFAVVIGAILVAGPLAFMFGPSGSPVVYEAAAPAPLVANAAVPEIAPVAVPAEAVAPPLAEATPDPAPEPIIVAAEETAPETAPAPASTGATDDRFDAGDNAAISAALKHAVGGRYDQARVAAAPVSYDVLDTLIDWYQVRNANLSAGFAGISAFMREHGDWPLMDTIRTRAEGALYKEKPDPAIVIAHFAAFPPRMGLGKLALARALIATGEMERAGEFVSSAWRGHEFGSTLDKQILREFRSLLDKGDHRARLVRQIYERHRAAGMRTAALISSAHEKMARAASDLFRRRRSALRRYRQVPASLRGQLAMQYALAYYYRRKGKVEQHRDVVAAVPGGAEELSYPGAWWIERRDAARTALRRNTPELWETSYALCAAHSFREGTYFVQGEFMAGWIALQFLKSPERAIPHFERILERDSKALNIAQAHYWLGRAYQAQSNGEKAGEHFRAAGAIPTSFYGQLALDALGIGDRPLVLATPPDVSPAAAEAFAARDMVQAIRLMEISGQKGHLRTFFLKLAHALPSTQERVALVTLARELDVHHIAMRAAKISARRGDDLGHFAYPHGILPDYERRGEPVEEALIHALIRQESEFNATVQSHAGARGLMQLMPGTAKIVARQHGVRYRRAHLTERPAYNLMLGTAHVGDLIRDLGGSYIMPIAAYNAGAGRIPQWNGRYGDPRLGEIEPVNWIESIPFNETRNYVKRVMENLLVYRTLMGTTPFTAIGVDLTRGGEAPQAPETPEETVVATDCETEPDADTSIEQLIACN